MGRCKISVFFILWHNDGLMPLLAVPCLSTLLVCSVCLLMTPASGARWTIAKAAPHIGSTQQAPAGSLASKLLNHKVVVQAWCRLFLAGLFFGHAESLNYLFVCDSSSVKSRFLCVCVSVRVCQCVEWSLECFPD